MSRPTRITRALAATAVTTLVCAGLAGTAAAHEPDGGEYRTVLEGLSSPLGLAVGRDGSVHVAEAPFDAPNQITSVDRRGTVRHLPVEGSTSGVAVGRDGSLVYTLSAFPEVVTDPVETFVKITDRRGRTRVLASPSAYEAANNPDTNTYGVVGIADECLAGVEPQLVRDVVAPHPGLIESNPYAVAVDGRSTLVADAAMNAVLRVRPDGRVSTVAVLPPVAQTLPDAATLEAMLEGQLAGDPEAEPVDVVIPECLGGATFMSEPVPTDVEVGRDGNYYVSTLPGSPELPGYATVFKIDRRGGEVTQVATGFTGAVDLAVDRRGTIYVAELFANQISTISRGGQVNVFATVDSPGAVEVGRDGDVYAAVGAAAAPGGGSVIEFDRTGRRS